MIKYIRFVILFFFALSASAVMAQSTATTSSPYSKYGLGLLSQDLLPQQRGMGGIGAAINKIGGYNLVNSYNPASYGFINLTTIDVGASANFITLNQSGASSQTNGNFRLSHITFAVPVSKRSALAFGLKPYSELGYNYTQTKSNLGSGLPSDTNSVNYIYSGEGGLSKAFIGYGFGLGKHFYFGGNVSYIFGNLEQFSSTEIPNLYGGFNTRLEQSNNVGGLNYDFGTQVTFDVAEATHLTFGYSGSASTQLNSQSKYILSQYSKNFTTNNEGLATDTLVNRQSSQSKIKLPLINHFGFSLHKENKYLFGADYSTGKWSDLTIGGVNQGLSNSQSFNVGGQITPNYNALHNYFALMDYSLGFKAEKTYITINDRDIKAQAITFGLGFPLPRNNTSFYKINFSAEVGRRGSLAPGLIRENYFNFHLGFTLNDIWFRKYRFD
ncbi:hypothetical protein MUY27_13550 [Mucilaginibacter sp. RS28]|uniref:Long-chain fatty acid transport protein n=1 Tax=Mucilaginibacter straminoryzae TaxID=2932774 RepID=A0A9X2BCB3_9SPHI|nr:hypothetical protein [Mucilaginibacter straminoryzae]MCJ8210737.1 hypothetical protein [Mucilaginibacter straminoryzae]